MGACPQQREERRARVPARERVAVQVDCARVGRGQAAPQLLQAEALGVVHVQVGERLLRPQHDVEHAQGRAHVPQRRGVRDERDIRCWRNAAQRPRGRDGLVAPVRDEEVALVWARRAYGGEAEQAPHADLQRSERCFGLPRARADSSTLLCRVKGLPK